jgi:hypothetical protein
MISRIANFVADLESLGFFLTLLVGVGLLGYLGVSWLFHLGNSGQYLVAIAVGGLLFGSVAMALLRIPLAQIVVLGSAIVCGTAFVLGYGNVLLP